MISYCHRNGLILNNHKTQLLVSPKQECQIKVGSSTITASHELNLLGVDFDTNFTTLPFLHKLARAAKTRSSLIYRLSFSMPPHLLSIFANGLLMGKILAACPLTIPARLNHDDKCFISVTDDINKAIKATARTITRTKLSDKVRSEVVVHKANMRCLNEAVASITAVTVWKSRQSMDPLGRCLFPEKETNTERKLRSQSCQEIRPPVPGYPNLATNIMAKIWNSVPDLRNASTIGTAKSISRKWAKTIPR